MTARANAHPLTAARLQAFEVALNQHELWMCRNAARAQAVAEATAAHWLRFAQGMLADARLGMPIGLSTSVFLECSLEGAGG